MIRKILELSSECAAAEVILANKGNLVNDRK